MMPALFDEAALRKLEQLTLVADSVRVGVMKGERRSRKRGTSIEFADYRDYSRGDDLRRLDWNVYARLERPFIKLLEEEEDLAVHLLVDNSRSMDWPDDPEQNKLRYALRLCGALGYIALHAGDQVSVTLLDRERRRWGPYRGRPNSLRLLQFLDAVSAAGETNLNAVLQDYALRGGRPGLLLLLSDMLSPAGYREGLNALLARGYEVGILHVLSPDELQPPLAGDLKLVDVETGEDAEISLDGTTLAAYEQRLRDWQPSFSSFSAAHGPCTTCLLPPMPWAFAHPACGGRAQVTMAFLAPLALLLGLLAVPIIVLYMLRLRRREVLVSSTLLWRKLLRDREANAPWQRLRRNLLLILQLLILAALVLALARPYLPTPSVVSGSVVVLLDASASMQATDVEPSRFEQAREIVDEWIGNLGGDDRMTLILAGRLPRVLASASNDREALREALAAAQPEAGSADWPAALPWQAAPRRDSAMHVSSSSPTVG